MLCSCFKAEEAAARRKKTDEATADDKVGPSGDADSAAEAKKKSSKGALEAEDVSSK